MGEFFNYIGLATKGLEHVKEFYQWYIANVDGLESPNHQAVEYRNTYEKFLKFWDETSPSEEKQKIVEEMISFYISSIEDCKEFIDDCGDCDYDISYMMELDEEVLKLLKAIE